MDSTLARAVVVFLVGVGGTLIALIFGRRAGAGRAALLVRRCRAVRPALDYPHADGALGRGRLGVGPVDQGEIMLRGHARPARSVASTQLGCRAPAG